MNTSGNHVDTLLGAWALDACDVDEAAAVAAHLPVCVPCADEAASLRRAASMLGDLAVHTGDAGPPPRGAVFAAARRTGRRPAPTVPSFAAPFAATAGLLESVLAEVDDEVWALPSGVLDWSAGELVAHLAANDGVLAAALGLPPEPPVQAGQDAVARSAAFIAVTRGLGLPAARAWPRERVHRHWRAGVDAIAARLLAEPGLATRIVDVGGNQMSVADQVTARAFETWTHARDIAELAGVRMPAPSGQHLAPITDLAARILDSLPRYGINSAHGGPAPSGAVQLTLTGPGGGSWLVRVGTEATPPATPDAEVVADTVEFCLLVADRRTIDELGAVITGDSDLARELLALAPLLARP